ncbi:hypothetical protein ACHAXT_005753 [Thalassiosira profunda]
MDDDNFSLSSSSSSSDDGFLASAPGGGKLGPGATPQDREALVRKKLLESFYGAAAAEPEQAAAAADDDDEDEGDGEGGDDGGGLEEHIGAEGQLAGEAVGAPLALNDPSHNDPAASQSSQHYISPAAIPQPFHAAKSDLDSPAFDPRSHAVSHIAHSSVRTLLETNERLALDIRTLDSTVQTLVYENYSKFIDATDAIRTIGAGVGGSIGGGRESGLERLVAGMDTIREASETTERLLQESRDAVAEKLRIQRLLTRLDALLSLPATLRTDIAAGKYRTAVRSHGQATEILGRHSAGFESLRSIEGECSEILTELADDLQLRLVEWSGGGSGSGARSNSYASGLDADRGPNSIAEIFECAGTLLLLDATPFGGMDRTQCQTLALRACGRLLGERLLVGGGGRGATVGSPPNSPGRNEGTDGEGAECDLASELPLTFLDGMLEAATLYGVSFEVAGRTPPPDDGERERLASFVEGNFDAFLSRARTLLIEKGAPDSAVSENSVGEDEEDSREDAAFAQISLALSHLLLAVRELASGLALPEVGLDVERASGLVDRAVELAEALVRRRVAARFDKLRGQVARECLAPLVRQVLGNNGAGETAAESKEGGKDSQSQQPPSLAEIVQLASVALSDGLQMADDLIRAALSPPSAGEVHMAAPVDAAVVKLAVQASARSFGAWLARALERLAGCEPDDGEEDGVLLEVWDESEGGEEGGETKKKSRRIVVPSLDNADGNEIARQYGSTNSTSFSRADSRGMEAAPSSDLLAGLAVAIDDRTTDDNTYAHFLLALGEMGRLGARSLAGALDQSIRAAVADENARAAAAEAAGNLFGEALNPHRKGRDGLDSEGVLSQRFRLAASRALAMYVLDRGAAAASLLCSEMEPLADASDPYAIPVRPREACLGVFAVAKAVCEDCIGVAGGDLFAAPVRPFPEEMDYVDVFGERLVGAAGGGAGAASGLQLDVERMFIEKTQVYPHPSDQCDFTRNAVVSGVLRVALAAFLERVRSSALSSLGYRQLKVDVVFLRYVMPHFVTDEFGTPEAHCRSSLFNIMDDAMLQAGQRCFDHEVTGDDDYYDVNRDEIVTPYQLVQQFIEGGDGEDVMKRVAFS